MLYQRFGKHYIEIYIREVSHVLVVMLFNLIIEVSDCCTPNIQLMEAEVALYWRMICRHLQMAAQVSLPVTSLYFVLFYFLFISMLFLLTIWLCFTSYHSLTRIEEEESLLE